MTKDPEDTSGEIGNDDTDEGNNDNDINDDVNNDNDDADNDNDDVNNENDDNDSESIDNDENDMEQDSEDEEADLEAEDEIADLEAEEISEEGNESDIETYALDSTSIEECTEITTSTKYSSGEILKIYEYKLPEGEELTPESLESIFQYYGDKSYREISFVQEDTAEKIIKKDIYNACIPHLIKNTDTSYISFQYGERYSDGLILTFDSPVKIDSDLSGNVSVTEENSKIYLNLPKENAYLGSAVDISIECYQYTQIYQTLHEKFSDFFSDYSPNRFLCLYDSKGDKHAKAKIKNYNGVTISGTDALTEAKYRIDENDGTDTWVTECVSESNSQTDGGGAFWFLYINIYNKDIELTKEAMEVIFRSFGNKTYYQIRFRLNYTEDNQINKDIYNACIPHLRSSQSYIDIDFYDTPVSIGTGSTNYITRYSFTGPNIIDHDINANAFITEENSEFYFNLPNKNAYSGCAKKVLISFNNLMDIAETLKEKFGDKAKLYLYDSNGKRQYGDANDYVNFMTRSFDDVLLAGLDNIRVENLTDTRYRFDVLQPEAYEESTINGKTYLYIKPQEGTYKDGEVENLLTQFHKNKKYDYISISPGIGWKISADICNTVIPYLEAGGQIIYEGSSANNNVSWYLKNPSVMSADVSPAVTLIGTDGEITVQVRDISKLSAESFDITHKPYAYMETQYNRLFGEDVKLYLFEEGSETPLAGVTAYWGKENAGDSSSLLSINGVEKLEEGVTYTLKDFTYRGDVYEVEGVKYLSISSAELNKDKFSPEDLKSIIEWYKNKGEEFDHIYLEEKYSTNNLIQKDYFNLAASVLKDEKSGLTFVFRRSEENGYNDLHWNFSGCKQGINKDINGNVTLTPTGNYGVTFQLNAANTYPSGNTNVVFLMEAGTSSAGQLKAALGEPKNAVPDGQPAVLKGTTALTDLQVYYTGNNSRMQLSILDVSKWTAKTNYTIMPVYETAGFSVGESIELAKLSGKLDYPEGAADPKWTSLTTDLISVADGKLSFLDGGNGYVLLSYKSGKSSCLRLYRIPISKQITRITMDKELTMDLEYKNGIDGDYADCIEKLELKVYPADAGFDIYDPGVIRWESGDSEVVKILKDESGRFTGIQALKPGEAVITASYIGNLEDGSKPTITASCKVTVRAPLVIKSIPGEKDELFAVTNFDTTISAVALPDGWKWANDAAPLSSFAGMESSVFPAVYTDASGRTEPRNLKVRMITVTGIRILQVDKKEDNGSGNGENNEEVQVLYVSEDNEITKEPELFIAKDNKQTVTYTAELQFASGGPMTEDEWTALSGKWKDAGYKTVWSSSQKNLGAAENNSSRWQFTVDGNTAKGKKTITATIQNSKNKKVFAASHSVTVTEKPVVDFPDSVMDVSDIKEGGMFTNVYDEAANTGTLTITIPKEKYSKLTITSKDTAILKTGKIGVVTGDVNVVTTVPYERKGYGIAPVVITASDERKSSCTLRFTFVDTTPKLLTQTVTLNKKMTEKAADILIQCEKGYTVAGNVSVEDKYSGMFNIECVKGATGTTGTTASPDTLKISLKDNSVKKGKYKVNITVPIKAEAADNNANADTAADTAADAAAVNKDLTVTVSVVETLPSVTVKQTKKVNTFYNDAEGYGMLSITANGAKVKDVSLDAKCDYELVPSDEDNGVYIVKPKANAAGKVKKGTLSYKLEGYDGNYTKSVTIGTANTKPVIVLSQKSDTLYSGAGYRKTSLVLTEKTAGTPVSAADADIQVKDAEDKNYKKLVSGITIKGSSKNYYQINAGDNGILDIQLAADKPVSSCTDKIPLRIQKPNWSGYIDVTYSVKVDTKAPKLKLSKATVTLNKNVGVYGYQQAETNLSLNGCSAILKDGDANVRVYFTGKDNASNNALKINGNLVLQYKEEQGCITARFNDNDLKTGNYKYNVCVEIRPDEGDVIKASTALTVKVVDSIPEKCISVSTKGSIDLLDREGTGIAVTPKLSNVTGTVTGGWLTDKDAGLFDSDFEDGKLYIRAKEGKYYSTKHTYKVKAAFWVVTGYHSYKMVSKELSFKVKQGKPKIKVSSETANTLYRTTGNEIELKIEALLGTKAVEIEEVYLVNFTDDLELVESKAKTGQNYDTERHSVRIKATGKTKNIMQNGKTQSVKLAVRYRDKAGDVKDTQITYKICVR